MNNRYHPLSRLSPAFGLPLLQGATHLTAYPILAMLYELCIAPPLLIPNYFFWLLATGYWLLATGYWLLATGYWLLKSLTKF